MIVPAPLLSLRRAAAARVSSAPYLTKWLVLGVVIGVVAGLGAVVFVTALEFATHLLLGVVGGYTPPSPANEGGVTAAGHFARSWAIPLIVGLGGLVSGILVYRFAPEASGHGTDAAIAAVHNGPKGIRLKSDETLFATPEMQLRRGDDIVVVTPPEHMDALSRLLASQHEDIERETDQEMV